MRPIAVDLFAGAGGLAEGLESAGIRVVAASELHPQAALTHALNHPETDVFYGDIRSLAPDLLLDHVERRTGRRSVDLVVGGPPCQGFSTAGKKNAEDPRNSLFYQFVRFVEALSPRMFLLENVPGFKKMHGGLAFQKASELFRGLGYEVDDCLLDASNFGVPQRRLRFVMVGWRKDKGIAAYEWPSPTHTNDFLQQGLFEDQRLPFVNAFDALEDIAFLEPGWEAHRHQGPPCSSYQVQRRNGCEVLFNHLATRHRPKAVEIFSHIPEGGTIAGVPDAIKTAKRTMARLHRAQISNAVLALPDDLIHYRHERIPSVREMARLQSFDDDYVFIGKRTSGFMERRVDVPQYTQVGNAVPPLLGKALGLSLLRALGEQPQDVRDLGQRREMHRLIRGSSGFAGYGLDESAEGRIALFHVFGTKPSLPLSHSDRSVLEAPALVEWKALPAARTGQWIPAIPDVGGIREMAV